MIQVLYHSDTTKLMGRTPGVFSCSLMQEQVPRVGDFALVNGRAYLVARVTWVVEQLREAGASASPTTTILKQVEVFLK